MPALQKGKRSPFPESRLDREQSAMVMLMM